MHRKDVRRKAGEDEGTADADELASSWIIICHCGCLRWSHLFQTKSLKYVRIITVVEHCSGPLFVTWCGYHR